MCIRDRAAVAPKTVQSLRRQRELSQKLVYTKSFLRTNSTYEFSVPFLASETGGSQLCPKPVLVSSALPSEMPTLVMHMVKTEDGPKEYAPFYLSETYPAYKARWELYNKWSGILCKPNANASDTAISKNLSLIHI